MALSDSSADPAAAAPLPAVQGAVAPKRQTLRDVLWRIANRADQPEISLNDILLAVGDRTFGALMLVLAMPNLFIAIIPGISIIFGVPLLLIGAQLLWGFPKPWLPKKLAHRAISMENFRTVVKAADPWLAKAEKLFKPRLQMFTATWAERFIGLVCMLMAALLILPIPAGNFLPGLTLCLFGLALLERDGLMALVATATMVGTIVFFGTVAWGTFVVLTKAAHSLLGI
jgi:hypothetical protein